MNNPTRRSTIRFLIGTAISAAGAAVNSVRWMRSARPDAPVEAKVWLFLCAFSVVLGVGRFLYYRNRRNYFAEEMDHRRALVTKSFKAKVQ